MWEGLGKDGKGWRCSGEGWGNLRKVGEVVGKVGEVVGKVGEVYFYTHNYYLLKLYLHFKTRLPGDVRP